jgi:hypothetical protein
MISIIYVSCDSGLAEEPSRACRSLLTHSAGQPGGSGLQICSLPNLIELPETGQPEKSVPFRCGDEDPKPSTLQGMRERSGYNAVFNRLN